MHWEEDVNTYKWAVMIHVQNTHSTGSTMMTSRWLWLWAELTEGIILKGTFPHSWIATPHYAWGCSSTRKWSRTECINSSYRQHEGNDGVKNSMEIADREKNRECCPHSTTCNFNICINSSLPLSLFEVMYTFFIVFCGKNLTIFHISMKILPTEDNMESKTIIPMPDYGQKICQYLHKQKISKMEKDSNTTIRATTTYISQRA